MVEQPDDANSNLETRALDVWHVLTQKALDRQLLTFMELADILENRSAGAVGIFVVVVGQYCEQSGLPMLPALVMKKDGHPGKGYFGDGERLQEDLEDVFSYNWLGVTAPTPEQLKQIHDKYEGRGG